VNTLNTISVDSKSRYICPQLVSFVSSGAFGLLSFQLFRTYIESKAKLFIGQREHVLQLEVFDTVL
jgi:hypothetical protein